MKEDAPAFQVKYHLQTMIRMTPPLRRNRHLPIFREMVSRSILIFNLTSTCCQSWLDEFIHSGKSYIEYSHGYIEVILHPCDVASVTAVLKKSRTNAPATKFVGCVYDPGQPSAEEVRNVGDLHWSTCDLLLKSTYRSSPTLLRLLGTKHGNADNVFRSRAGKPPHPFEIIRGLLSGGISTLENNIIAELTSAAFRNSATTTMRGRTIGTGIIELASLIISNIGRVTPKTVLAIVEKRLECLFSAFVEISG